MGPCPALILDIKSRWKYKKHALERVFYISINVDLILYVDILHIFRKVPCGDG